MKLSNKNGTILIVALWTLVILTLLALGLGRRVSLEISLAGFDRDKLKALELAKAAIEKAILEKQNDTVVSIDALSESWAVDQEGL